MHLATDRSKHNKGLMRFAYAVELAKAVVRLLAQLRRVMRLIVLQIALGFCQKHLRVVF